MKIINCLLFIFYNVVLFHHSSYAGATDLYGNNLYSNSEIKFKELLDLNPIFALLYDHLNLQQSDLSDPTSPIYLSFEKALKRLQSNVSNENFPGAIKDMFNILKTHPIHLILNSPGGEVFRMLAIYEALDLVPPQNLYANIPSNGYCASACAMIYLYVGNRTCEKGSKIGLHSVHFFGLPMMLKTTESILQLMNRERSSAPKIWLLRQVENGVFDRVDMTNYSCETLVHAGIASFKD